jgi:hypothetical protein
MPSEKEPRDPGNNVSSERLTRTGIKQNRTAEEQSIIDQVARSEGKEWAEAHSQLILDQARAFGEL